MPILTFDINFKHNIFIKSFKLKKKKSKIAVEIYVYFQSFKALKHYVFIVNK